MTLALVVFVAVLLSTTTFASSKPAPTASARDIAANLGCAACHVGMPERGSLRELGPSLDSTVRIRSREYLLSYLRNPERRTTNDGQVRMPDFRFDDREALALTLYLTQHAPLQGAQRTVTAEQGRQIFLSQNCAGCHRFGSTEPSRNGPDLAGERSRVRPDWLRKYLISPSPVRPFGTQPGSGGRMPDYRLSSAEADSIAALLGSARRRAATLKGRALSPFAMAKAEALIRDQLSCLGCHRLGDSGGRIGPDLSQAGSRLDPGFVRAMIADPRRTVPGTIMPKVPMPPATLDLIVGYLVQRSASPEDTTRLSLIDNQLILPVGDSSASGLYAANCAPCHGLSGKGDGFNARALPIPPAVHASRESMSLRSDDTIYDAIHAGAFMLGRSNRMPGFGESLTRQQIHALVRYIRTLCSCEGPSWSRDGSPSGL